MARLLSQQNYGPKKLESKIKIKIKKTSNHQETVDYPKKMIILIYSFRGSLEPSNTKNSQCVQTDQIALIETVAMCINSCLRIKNNQKKAKMSVKINNTQ